MAEQPYLLAPEGTIWIRIRDGNDTALSLFLRHYSARQRRKIRQFIGPGEKMPLITPDAKAIFAWRKFISDNGQVGVNCAIFRNENSAMGRSSDLILAAICEARGRWPSDRLYTYVDATKVRSSNPGCCFKKAGFSKCGVTKDGKLIFERLH